MLIVLSRNKLELLLEEWAVSSLESVLAEWLNEIKTLLGTRPEAKLMQVKSFPTD